MKKLCSLALVLVFIFTLAACGNSTASNESSIPTGQLVENNTDVSSLVSSTEEISSVTEESSSTQTVATSSKVTETSSKPAPISSEAPSSSKQQASSKVPVSSEKPASSSKVETSSAAPVHTHSFAAANCTTPKTCSCGATEGSALGHNWTAATCTTPKTCSVCNVTDGKALEHKWTAATCSAPKTCEVCAKTEGEALAHDFYAGECKVCKIENPAYKLASDAYGSYTCAIVENNQNSPSTAVGDLNLYGLYIDSNLTACTWYENTGSKNDETDEYYIHNDEKYFVVFDGGFDPSTFKEIGSAISSVSINAESGLITLPLSSGVEPLILKHFFENGTHILVAQNSYIVNFNGTKFTLIPKGSVFKKH